MSVRPALREGGGQARRKRRVISVKKAGTAHCSVTGGRVCRTPGLPVHPGPRTVSALCKQTVRLGGKSPCPLSHLAVLVGDLRKKKIRARAASERERGLSILLLFPCSFSFCLED